ncbi:hypothetical protein [Micromonospora sp. NPDC005299]|uniref:hypothetical protein n=1 Tax=Micromonospora sp. NPDC005299 TaxID=3364231 RepID=UPI00368C18F9
MLNEIRGRLAQMEQEYRTGEQQLGELLRREVSLRETMLRISGAVQVLQELLPVEAGDVPGAAAAGPVGGADVARVEANDASGSPSVLTVP